MSFFASPSAVTLSLLGRLFLCCSLLISASLFPGCSWLGKAPPPPLPGKRISVENYDTHLTADPKTSGIAVTFPPCHTNDEWTQTGGNAAHHTDCVTVPAFLKKNWSKSIGNGSSSQNRLLSLPVIANNKVYTLDTSFLVTCFDFKSGERLWEVSVASQTRKGVGLGGGLAYAKDHIIVTTGVGEVYALDAATGTKEWQADLNYPVRAAPTIFNDSVYVLSLQNTLTALDIETGAKQWTHAGSSEVIGILGGAAPAATQGKVIVAYSSGEVFALSPDTGDVLWAESLARPIFNQGVDSLSHIRAAPVIDENAVYVMSHSGPLVSFDISTGARNWEQPIGGINSIVATGNFLFVLAGTGDFLCLEASTGRIKWVCPLKKTSLPPIEGETPSAEVSSDDPCAHIWGGPLLTSSGLLLTSDEGLLYRLDPQTGKLLDQKPMGESIVLSPIAAQNRLITLSDVGYLTCWEKGDISPS